jgi:radical SAM superfamily enzyme YgiQ (UPF0313 family)
MNVYLIQPPVSGEKRYGKYADVGSYLPPLGLCYLASTLLKNSHNAKIIDGIIENYSFEEIYNKIVSFNTDIMGISATSLFYEPAIKLAEYIKKKNKDLVIIIGGVHISVVLENGMHDCFDFGVFGEGEETLLELIEAIERKDREYSKIKGIIYRKDNKLYKTEPRPLIEDLDSLGHPNIELLEKKFDYKITALVYKRLPMMTIISSRGCPFNCLFCSNDLFGRKYRMNSAEFVLDELEKLVNKYGYKEIMFYEDNFPVDKNRVFDICNGIIERRLKFTWGCSAHANCLSEDKLDIMKKAGCWIISIGIESGDEKIIKIIRKNYNKEHLVKIVKYADKIGIAVRGFFILGNPGETKETLQKTLDLSLKLPLYTVNFCLMSLFPGSEIYKVGHKYGQTDYDLSLITGHPSGDKLSFIANGFSAEQLINIQKKFYRKFYFRISQIWRILKNINSIYDIIKYFKLVKTFLKITVMR